MMLTPTPNVNAPAPPAPPGPADQAAADSPGLLKLIGWASLPLVPLLAGVVLLSLLGPVTGPLTAAEADLFKQAIATDAFLPGTMNLIAVLIFHVCIGMAVLYYAWNVARNSGGRHTFWLGVAMGLALLAVILVFSFWRWTVYDVSYYQFYELYDFDVVPQSKVEEALLDPRLGSLSALALAVLIPVGLGLVTLAAVVGVANHQLHWAAAPPTAEATVETKLLGAGKALKRCLYLLSLGLVTSTVAASLFFHLPTKLPRAELKDAPAAIGISYADLGKDEARALRIREDAAAVNNPAFARTADPDVKGKELALGKIELAGKIRAAQQSELAALKLKLSDYAAELSTFWGAVFAATLVLAIGIPWLRLQDRISDHLTGLGGTARTEARDRFSAAGLVGQSRLELGKLLLALIAPLVTGPIANLVQAAAG